MSKKNTQVSTIQTNKSVSIVTITQFSRFKCIIILLKIIKNQTYKNIIEWILVEGSQNENDCIENEKNINKFIEQFQSELYFPITYIKKHGNIKLGELRNIGNKSCNGDITVCMDDDDYYFPNRIEHAVTKLSDSKYNIAGCSNSLMYDYDLNIFAQMKPKLIGPYHSVNSCMAWKKEYLLTNSHDPTIEFGEESSFTKKFTEPMVSLDPYCTMISSSHSSNTFDKKIFFVKYLNKLDTTIDKIIYKPINKYIPNDILLEYKNIFTKIDDIDYDIVYMCGTFSIDWDPIDQKLGGSEQAVVNLSENWVKNGKSVIVYGNVPDKIVNNVVYKPWKKFNFNKKYKNIIFWRNFGLSTILPFNNIKADFIAVDVHDNFIQGLENIFEKYYKKCDKIFLKSNYHKECLLNNIDKNINQDNIVVIPNGIRIDKFSICPNGIQRNPYRFCYCSCYLRGLDKIISILWPIIYNYEPRAELHVYYGMNGISENYQNYLKMLLAQPGVMDHGRQPVEMIIREKYMSTYHFYITNTESEIDCISIRESLVTGCIPLLSNFGVFKERAGIHFDFNDDNMIKMAAIKIIQLLQNTDNIDEVRKKIINDPTIIGWDTIASEWLKYFVD